MERMKYIRLLWLLLPFLWQSCAEDKGNYDYNKAGGDSKRVRTGRLYL